MVHALTPSGEGVGCFHLPFPSGRANRAFGRLSWPGRDLRPASVPAARTPGSLGETLFRALFPEEILRLYERSVDLLGTDAEAGLRIEIMLDPRDSDLAALQALPWEFLRRPETPEFLSLQRRRSIVRYLMVARPIAAAIQPRVFRILAVAAAPRSLPALDLDREIANLRQAVGTTAGIEVVTPLAPTLAGLRQALRERECHVLHFLGHGGAAGSSKALFFETSEGEAAPVLGTDLANKLADFTSLRLVVLNACDSAAVPREAELEAGFDAFAGIASSMVQGGLPAVVAMQMPISDRAAIAFSAAFYSRLAAGDPVDAAVAEGRQEIHSGDPAGSEWATPVLFLRSPTGELYPEKSLWERAARKARARLVIVAALFVTFLGGAAITARSLWVERQITQGQTLFAQGQFSAARARFASALRLAPGSPEILSHLAGCEVQLGETELAEKHYREEAQQAPDSAVHLANLGNFLNSRGSYVEAYKVLFKAVAQDPLRADTYADLAEAAAGRNWIGKARTILGVALHLDPERPAFYRRMGALDLAAGDPRAALAALAEARSRSRVGDTEQIETAWLSADASNQLGDARAACGEIRRLHDLNPSGDTPWAMKATELAVRLGCK
jgi:Tfp pilus assembly protein PilF